VHCLLLSHNASLGPQVCHAMQVRARHTAAGQRDAAGCGPARTGGPMGLGQGSSTSHCSALPASVPVSTWLALALWPDLYGAMATA
jgi:hypothetical protein